MLTYLPLPTYLPTYYLHTMIITVHQLQQFLVLKINDL